MSRYFTRPKASRAFYVDDDCHVSAMIPSLAVPDHVATDTGLLDANGDTIWRGPRPIGFGRDEEW